MASDYNLKLSLHNYCANMGHWGMHELFSSSSSSSSSSCSVWPQDSQHWDLRPNWLLSPASGKPHLYQHPTVTVNRFRSSKHVLISWEHRIGGATMTKSQHVYPQGLPLTCRLCIHLPHKKYRRGLFTQGKHHRLSQTVTKNILPPSGIVLKKNLGTSNKLKQYSRHCLLLNVCTCLNRFHNCRYKIMYIYIHVYCILYMSISLFPT